MENNINKEKSKEEDIYVDLLESLKNDAIKEYVNRTLIEKVGENRNVKRVLEVLTKNIQEQKEKRGYT